MTIRGHLLIGITILGFAAEALAVPTEWRTQVQVSVGSGTGTQFAFDGGLNVASSSQTLSSGSNNALAEASSDLSVTGFVPTLRARATAAPTSAQAVAWGVQGYTNVGADPLSTTLFLNLTADITGSNDVKARLYLFEEANFDFSTDPGTILFESSSQLWPGFDSFANNAGPTGFDVLFNNHTGPVNEQRSFDFTVQPGDSFYVWSRLVATADNTGVADAFGTLTASFSNIQGLEPAAVVPEPSAFILLATALLALLRRRKLHTRAFVQ